MSNCNICGRPRHIILSNKLVCTHCDEMLFDMEIEIDSPTPKTPAPKKQEKTTQQLAQPKAKILKMPERKPAQEAKVEAEDELKDTDGKNKVA